MYRKNRNVELLDVLSYLEDELSVGRGWIMEESPAVFFLQLLIGRPLDENFLLREELIHLIDHFQGSRQVPSAAVPER